jgi:HD-like signal output (HDOD) protein
MKQQLIKMIEKEGVLPPFPEIISRLRELIEDPNTGINEVAKVIKSDPVLSGKLIGIANSVYGGGAAFFAADLNRALSRLGLKLAMDLAYSLKLSGMFDTQNYIDKNQFWRYSLSLGVLSSRIAQIYGANQEEASYAYLGGLMRHVGIILYSYLIPDEYGEFIQELRSKYKDSRVRRRLTSLEPLEERAFGISSTDLACVYIRKWWFVEQPVLEYIEHSSKILYPKVEHSVEIARYFLAAEGRCSGILDSKVKLPEGFFEDKLEISPEQYNQLQIDLQESLTILG